MDLALKRPWVSLLVFFCVGMVHTDTGEMYGPQLKIDPKTMTRIIQMAMTDKKILDGMATMATKNKALKGLKGMKLKDFRPPEICTKLIPPKQMQTSVIITLTVAGKSFIGGKMEITLKSKMDIVIKVTKHPTKHIGMEKTSCEVRLLAYKTNLPSNMIPKVVNKFLNTTLGKLLPGMMCPAADNVIGFMETKLEHMFEKKSFGENRTMWYEVVEDPEVFPDYKLIQLKAKFQSSNGEIIEATPDPVPEGLPPKEEGKNAVYLPVAIINVAVTLMDGLFNSVITEIEGSTPTTDQLKEILPDADLPAGKEVRIEIAQKVNVTFIVSPTESHMTTHSKASFLSVEDGAELLSIDMVQECSANFGIKEERLSISLESGSCRTTEISSPAGDVEPAKDFMKTVMDVWIPQANNVLSKNQIPLPSLLGLMYREGEATLSFGENVLVFHVTIETYDETEMAERIRRYQEKPKTS
ncbi:BPI fold-containing family B member 6-like [Crotalus tigris]|uniref:BPI fold-containing family B member 6-like n=1 Tax=Crotalus tigris TaxID=88082 RepID=UPI00192FAF37|nr:BPI fold-containing family B member 6-like [Crotalus tigris]